MENLGEWEQKILLTELVEGMEGAKQLQIHLSMPNSTNESREFLLRKILNSYEKALSVLNWNSSIRVPESPPSLAGSPRSEDDSDQKFKEPENKDGSNSRKRKDFPNWNKQVKISTGVGLEGPLDDGFTWRKYGQKNILGAKYPRGYYRCTQRTAQGCLATKQVQRSDEDPTIFDIAYRGRHTCAASSSHLPPSPPPPADENQEPKQSPEILSQFPSSHFPSTSNPMIENFPSGSNNFSVFPFGNQNLQSFESEFTEMVISKADSESKSPAAHLDDPFDSLRIDPTFTFDYPGFF